MEGFTGKEIWVFGDLRSERLFGLSLNVLAKARELARRVAARAAIVMIGSCTRRGESESVGTYPLVSLDRSAQECVNYGADCAYILHNEHLAAPRADVYAQVLAHFVRSRSPALLLFPLTRFVRELAARTARIENAGLIAECVDLRIQDGKVAARCPSWGGDVMADISFSDGVRGRFVTVQAHAFRATKVRGEPGTVERIQCEDVQLQAGAKLLSMSLESKEGKRLEDANIVVVGGAGLGNMDHFGALRDLASALGGEVGATRPPVLQHWVDEERLIGQTGKTVRPDLLISVGTSGAVQYTAGIMEAKTIVAINRDPSAPIYELADLGIVTDARTFLPVLAARVKQATMRKLADALYEGGRPEAVKTFGRAVKGMREARQWSIEALAEATGQSPEFIGKVENEEITPSVSFLLRLANAMKIDPGTFLRREERAMIRNIRSREFLKRTQNYSYQTLSPGAENDHLRAFMITIEPKQAHKPVAYKHEGEEFVFVMEGELKLTVGNKAHHLKPGDSMHFNSDIPHKLKSTSNEMTRCLVVLYTP